jgi:hypothetical protein
MPPELALLETRVPATLLRPIRLHAALDAKTLDDFVREAIEECLRPGDDDELPPAAPPRTPSRS